MTGDTQPLYPEDLVQSTLPNFEPAPAPPAAPAPAPRATTGARRTATAPRTTAARTTTARTTTARVPRKTTTKAKKRRRFRFFGHFPTKLLEGLFFIGVLFVEPRIRPYVERLGVPSGFSFFADLGIMLVVLLILVRYF